MTDEERRYYKQAESNYYAAVQARNAAQNSLTNNTTQRNVANNKSTECSGQRTNLERRRDDVVNIIGLFGGIVEKQISSANTIAQNANSSYQTAIKCTGFTAASIFVSFRTKGVEEDNNAPQICRIERTRIETEIARLTQEINRLNALIEDFNRNININEATIAQRTADMKRYASIMKTYA